MTHRDSSYYPRRASFLSPLLLRFEACGRWASRYAFRIPDSVTYLGLLGGILIPGWAMYLRNPNRSGLSTVGVCGLLLLTFLAFLGQTAGNAAFTLLLSIHCIGLVAYCKPLLAEFEWLNRLLMSLLLCAMVIGLVYVPAQQFLSNHLFIPMRLNGHVVVVHRMKSPGEIHRGDWIAFNVSAAWNSFNYGYAHGSVVIRDGVNLAPVLALSGDEVKFDPHSYYVNGVEHPRQSTMPISGAFVVPENCWFAWPEFGMEGHGVVPAANISDPLLAIANVTPDRFVGKVFKHWFGRRQSFT